jgi:hypothetical protein
MLLWQLKQRGIDVDARAWHPLLAAQQQALRHYLLLKAAYQSITRALAHAEIPTLTLKGFALAHAVYPQPHLRPMLDLDLLVPYAQRTDALACMQNLGYAIDQPHQSAGVQQIFHHYHLRQRVAVELHYRLIPLRSQLLRPEQMEWFWSQTRVLAYDDLRLTALTPEADLLYLCAHCILMHGEFSFFLQRFLDVHLLIQKNPQLDWNMVVERAVTLRWTFAVARTLELARDYFGTTLDNAILQELASRRPAAQDLAHASHIHPHSTRLEATRQLMRGMNARERWIWFWGSILPTPQFMRWRYEFHSNWLLPFFYFWRWGIIAADAIKTMVKWARAKFLAW